jgi:hypothetical protein
VSETVSWTWADPAKRTWTREQLLEYIGAAHGIICNAAGAGNPMGGEACGASPGWDEAARRWIDAFPPS